MDAIAAFEVLIREHEAMLHSYVLGIVSDPGLTDDICQEAFVKAYQNLESLRDKGAFAPWLRTIARNLAVAECRRRNREVATAPEVLQGMEDVFGRLDDTSSGLSWPERSRAVMECLNSLPETLQSSCTLHYLEQKTAKAIAAVLDLSLAAVLKRLQRAREAIADCVSKKLGLDPL